MISSASLGRHDFRKVLWRAGNFSQNLPSVDFSEKRVKKANAFHSVVPVSQRGFYFSEKCPNFTNLDVILPKGVAAGLCRCLNSVPPATCNSTDLADPLQNVRAVKSYNSPCWEGPRKMTRSNLWWEREPRRDAAAPCPLKATGAAPHPLGGCSWAQWFSL